MLEKLHKKFTYLCNLDDLCPKFAKRKRGSDGRPSSLLERDTSYPKFAERKLGRIDGSLLTIGSLSVIRSLPERSGGTSNGFFFLAIKLDVIPVQVN